MNKIIIKHSSVPGAIPAAGDLTLGELAINVADGLVFAKQLDGSVKTLAEAIEIKSYGKIVGDVGSITATESAQEMTLKGGAGLKVTASNATNAIVVDLDNADAATLGGYAPSHFATADHLHDDRYLKLQSAGGDYYTQSEVDSNIQQAIDDLMGGASSAYDTLKELEEALKDNDSDIAGINAAIATKLAAADYNADDVLSKLKTVDGSGSGMDADLLDGQQGAFYRNASNLNAGTVPTARLSGIYNIGISGNAATATKLVAPVSLTLSGDASGSVSFDGSEDANINVTVANDSHTHDTRYYQKGESDGRYARLDSDNTISGNVTINGKLTAGSAGFKVGEGLEILGEDGYFPNSSYADARILRMLDNNSSGGLVDGGLVIEGYTASDDGRKEVMTLRTNGEFTAFGNKVWHAGNDGDGSELDADKLDGVEGSQFLRSDTTDTFTGEITGNTLILGGGKIQTSGAALQVNGFSRMGSIWLHEGDTPEATPAKKLTNSGGTLVWAGSTVWHAGNDGAGSTLDADLLDGQEGSYYAPINSPSFTTPDINDAKVRTLVFDNLEPTNVTNKGDGAVGFDSSQGLLIQRTQSIGDASGSGVYKVLDSSNVAAGANIELSNNEAGLSGTQPFTIAVKQGAGSGLDADKLDGVEASQFARLDGTGAQTSTKALTLDLQGHVNDGGNDYGLIIKAFEPAVTLLDRSTNADTGQLLFSNTAFYLRYQNANDGTIGHSDATVGTTNLMKVSTSEIQWMGNDVWHAGNAPIATSSTASTLMKRDGNGDVHARLFRSEFDNTNANIGFIMTQVDTASNNYIRPSTPDQFRAAVTDAHYLSNTGDTMSGTLTISGEGDTTGLRFYSGNDAGGVRLRNPGGNNGELEFWTTDDFSEPFVFRAYDVGNNGTGAYQEWAKISAGGLEIKSGDIHSNNGAFVAHGDVASNSNIDHIWHSDGENAWHFVSDGTYGADGNSTLVAKTLVASDANGIKAEGMVSKSNGNTIIDLTYTPIASNAIGIHTNNSIAAIFDTNNNSTDGNLNFTIGHNGSYGGTNYEELLKIDGIGNYFSKPIYEEGRRVLSEGGIGQFSFNNQDFKGRGKRIAVATTGDLILNYANDFTQVKVQSDMTLDAGTSTTLNILSDAAGISTLNVHGVDQGAGMIYVGQSDTHGGGIEYNGDESTVTTGAGSDYISLFRRNASTDYWTARNKYNSNDWGFRGNVTAYASDARLKENVEVIPDALSKLHQVRGVTYDWREECESLGFMPTQRHEHGVIAQEVQKVVPDAVVPAPFDNDYLTVQHERLIPLLIEAVKELSNKFDQLEARI